MAIDPARENIGKREQLGSLLIKYRYPLLVNYMHICETLNVGTRPT